MFDVYSYAVKLNNIGVELLTKDRAREGVETLRNALETIKKVFVYTEASDAGTAEFQASAIAIEQFLIRASSRLEVANLQLSRISSSFVKAICLDMEGLEPSTQYLAPAMSVFHPILIQSFSDPEHVYELPFEPTNPVIECSIIIYNLGLACLLTNQAEISETQSKRSASSLRLFNLAYSLIGRQLDISFEAVFTLQLVLHITGSIAQILHGQGDYQAANAALSRCRQISNALTNVGQIENSGSSVAPAA